MQNLVLARLEDRQANKPNSTNNGKNHGQDAQDLFAEGDVGDEATVVSQPALREEGEVEEHGRQDAADDEERLETVGADVGDVGDVGVLVHGRVAAAVLVHEPFEEEA